MEGIATPGEERPARDDSFLGIEERPDAVEVLAMTKAGCQGGDMGSSIFPPSSAYKSIHFGLRGCTKRLLPVW